MFRFSIIFIYLFATVSAINAQTLADSLYSAGDYRMAAVEYERAVFNATDRVETNLALRGKAACYKALERYSQAVETWQRVDPSEIDETQYVLCLYLSGQYEKAAQVVEEIMVLDDSVSVDILLLRVLSLNELNRYDEARSVAMEMVSKMGCPNDIVFRAAVDSLYQSEPKMKSEKIAKFLSIVPGLGHLYAGYPVEAVSAFVFNAGALAFGVWQVFEKCYFTAYFGGAGLLASSYPGLFESAATHVQKANFKRTDSFNRHCKERLLDMFVKGDR